MPNNYVLLPEEAAIICLKNRQICVDSVRGPLVTIGLAAFDAITEIVKI